MIRTCEQDLALWPGRQKGKWRDYVANTAVMRKPRESKRVGADAWVQAALDVLVSKGVDEIRVEALAKTLGITKGSFYHHFKDRSALLETLLDTWRRSATLGVIEWLERSEPLALGRLKRLIHWPCGRSEGTSIELAMRLWARSDKKAADVLDEVDRLRLTYIASLLRANGVSEAQATGRAALIYAYVHGESTINALSSPDIAKQCAELLLGDNTAAVQTPST